MNWKVVECKLLMILGIIVIACLGPCDPWIWGIRVGVIVILTLLFVFMPLICKQYVIDELKQKTAECVSLKDDISRKNLKIKEIEESNKNLANERETLEATVRGLKKENNIDMFYDFLLLKWAKDNGAPFTEESFNNIKEEFNKTINKE